MNLAEYFTRRTAYNDRVSNVMNFVGNAEGDVADGLFLMGLALANLDLLPVTSQIKIRAYWVRAPSPSSDPNAWESSWIMERDALHDIREPSYDFG